MNEAGLTLGSLFDGIAGFPLAAAGLGIKTIWTSEIEPNCVEIAARHFPEAKQLGDITKLNGADIDPVDIISFGSPCQNLSTAGNQRGLDGEKSQLFFEAVRIVYEMRGATNGKYPKYIIWENVAGAFSSNKGQDFRRALEEITKTYIPMPNSRRWAAAGMVRSRGGSTAWRMLDAQYWGVPQRRKRIYLVHSFGNDRAGQILFECESVFWDIAPGRAAGQDASGNAGRSTAAADRTPTVYTIAGNAIGRMGKNGGNQLGIGQDVSYTLTAADRHCVAVPEREAYRLSGYGDYKEGVGTLRASGGDYGGGSETICVL
ncbi:MAG: DNA (cytosine-5-)-methyltransferase [Muribaculum sp.]|nr:DNA (cytosine-5-)-methyltransferase [Muribaculum sp.]